MLLFSAVLQNSFRFAVFPKKLITFNPMQYVKLQNSFRFAVFPKKLITFNPMQYVKLRGRKQETDIFSDSEEDTASIPTITHEQFQKLEEFLRAKSYYHP